MAKSKPPRKKSKQTKTSQNDWIRIYNSYQKKLEEYELFPIEQLMSIRDSNTVRGSYLRALEDIIKIKQQIIEKQQE